MMLLTLVPASPSPTYGRGQETTRGSPPSCQCSSIPPPSPVTPVTLVTQVPDMTRVLSMIDVAEQRLTHLEQIIASPPLPVPLPLQESIFTRILHSQVLSAHVGENPWVIPIGIICVALSFPQSL